MSQNKGGTRREFLRRSAIMGGGLVLTGWLGVSEALAKKDKKDKKGEKVGPAEDLMREHGVMRRVLLIYEEVLGRIHERQEFPIATVSDAAQIIRDFVENYHEKLEEEYLFPAFRESGRQVDLVNVLYQQHQAGRALTQEVLRLTRSGSFQVARDGQSLAAVLHPFIRMYRPHAAREDTVLFPAFHRMLVRKDYDKLGEVFERREDELFGEDGFERMVERVAAIEQGLGINNLAQFTPRIEVRSQPSPPPLRPRPDHGR